MLFLDEAHAVGVLGPTAGGSLRKEVSRERSKCRWEH
jgi:7-keto-8-aminopelargonate synthetase-like enzyme